ncbi:MAG: DUF4349 domain-containing protein [Lachnospiraceae bacterium]|nr:DUF4349 domain-containing protein [Lachnospiraceae bacterium]
MKKHIRHPSRHLALLLSAAALSAALSGCGGGASKSMSAVETTAAAAFDRGYEEGFAAEYDAMPAETAAHQAMAAGGSDSAASTANTSSGVTEHTASDVPLPMERKLIRNMNLDVETMEFDSLVTAIQKKVAELQGYIEQSDISGNSITQMGRPSRKHASMTLRIPADKLNSFIAQVEADGNVTYKSETVSDVTLQYSDIESRLKTLRLEQERLWELMAKAETTEAIIALEARLTEVSSEIESSESRLRYLDNSVTYSTVYLNLSEVDLETPTEPETAWQQIQRGFARNLNALGSALTACFIGLISGSPILLFFILLILLAYFLIRTIHRMRNQPRKSGRSQTDRNKTDESGTAQKASQSGSAPDTARKTNQDSPAPDTPSESKEDPRSPH